MSTTEEQYPRRFAAQRFVTARELTTHPESPSTALRFIEAGMVAELARMVALDGRRWDAWPSFEVREDRFGALGLALFAEAVAR